MSVLLIGILQVLFHFMHTHKCKHNYVSSCSSSAPTHVVMYTATAHALQDVCRISKNNHAAIERTKPEEESVPGTSASSSLPQQASKFPALPHLQVTGQNFCLRASGGYWSPSLRNPAWNYGKHKLYYVRSDCCKPAATPVDEESAEIQKRRPQLPGLFWLSFYAKVPVLNGIAPCRKSHGMPWSSTLESFPIVGCSRFMMQSVLCANTQGTSAHVILWQLVSVPSFDLLHPSAGRNPDHAMLQEAQNLILHAQTAAYLYWYVQVEPHVCICEVQ